MLGAATMSSFLLDSWNKLSYDRRAYEGAFSCPFPMLAPVIVQSAVFLKIKASKPLTIRREDQDTGSAYFGGIAAISAVVELDDSALDSTIKNIVCSTEVGIATTD